VDVQLAIDNGHSLISAIEVDGDESKGRSRPHFPSRQAENQRGHRDEPAAASVDACRDAAAELHAARRSR
jgi:hypothetical protein